MWNTGLHTGYVPQIVFLQTDESLRIFISEKLPLYDAFLYSLVADLLPINLIIHKMLLQLFLFTTTYSSNLLMSLCQLFGDNLWSSLWLLGHAQKQYCVLCHPAWQWIVAVLSDALIKVYLQLPKRVFSIASTCEHTSHNPALQTRSHQFLLLHSSPGCQWLI